MFNSIIPIILVVVSGLVGFFYIEPKYDEIKSSGVAEKSIDDALRRANKIARITETLSAEMDSISGLDLDKLGVILPSDIDTIRFLNTLNGIVARHDLTLESARVDIGAGDEAVDASSGVAPRIPEVKILKVSFSVTASYDTFTDLLADLERSLMLMDIDSVSFSAVGKEKENIYKYGVKLRTYWMN
ncbi:MAG: hypothetical protein BMS9Abin13_362 [Patescibacteria group bacterium]|nr:MAG: hypothetical protein BMS9Abin13_362 [Patescibacteria group bacterium]